MTIRNLDRLLEPRSVALVGASRAPRSVGAALLRNLARGGFAGPLHVVHPGPDANLGLPTFPDVASLPEAPDLAVIATPAATVPGLVAELAARGTRAAVVISAGFADDPGQRGGERQQALLDAARPHLLRVLGPNCLGLLVPRLGLDASFAPVAPRPGAIAFVAQSGAVATSVLSFAHARGIGFSCVVSVGDMADVDFGDLLDWLALDPHTKAILLYVEALRGGRKFMSAGRAAARGKPVIVVKAGRSRSGARAALTHTGSLAGSDAVYEAALRRAGMLRVAELEELFDAAETLASGAAPRGDRLAIVTNGGGLGVLAADALSDGGGQLAVLAKETLAKLDEALPAAWSHGNPVDLLGDAGPERYAAAVAAAQGDAGVDAVLTLHCPTGIGAEQESAEAVAGAAADRATPVLASWLSAGPEVQRRFAAARVPSYPTPEQAVRGFLQLRRWQRCQELLIETPPSVPEQFAPDAARARAAVGRALAQGREWLDIGEVAEVLAAYGVEALTPRVAATPREAAEIAAELGAPVALKVRSPDVIHKTEGGGVSLDVLPAAVAAEAEALLARVAAARPAARLEGLSVQPMVHRRDAFELIVGASVDPVFGPVVLFGHGGTGTELRRDRALALPPLNLCLARELIARTRIGRLLPGWRGRPAADEEALALTLIRVAQLVADVGEIHELDLNPLLADSTGVLVLDARIRALPFRGPPEARLAIRPYPKDLEERVAAGAGRTLLVRPIRPEDEPSLRAAFAKLTQEEIRLRFFVPLKALSHGMAARLTQLDYDREMALVLTEEGAAGTTEIYGVARLDADPDLERAEFALIVRHDMTGRGFGLLLLRRLIAYARGRGIGELYGDVLQDNERMRKLCRELGFRERWSEGDAGVMRISLPLR